MPINARKIPAIKKKEPLITSSLLFADRIMNIEYKITKKEVTIRP
jgi:hypothetical protein